MIRQWGLQHLHMSMEDLSNHPLAVNLFPRLYNIKPFLCQNHPSHHPHTVAYEKYWEEQEIRCLEGLWGLDQDPDDLTRGGWRWMPGNLYYYINMTVIDDEDEDGNTTAVINPLLRDVEWIMAYGWATCRGFSGFQDDPDYTCHEIVRKIEQNEQLTPKEQRLVKKHEYSFKKPDGTYKKYVEAREYLYKTHKNPMGRAYWLNRARDFFVLGSRGFGKSFLGANMIVGHEFNFYGKKYFDDSYLDDPAGVEIFVGAALSSKSSDLLKKFSKSQEWLKKKLGAYGKGEDFIPGYFYNNCMGSLMPNNSKAPFRHKYKRKDGRTWVDAGTETTLYHGIYTTENPQAAVGTRPTVMLIEEVGLLPNVLTVHGANQTCQIRRTKFGSSYYCGTAGNMEKIMESKIIFEDPEVYGFLPYKDHWENRKKPIGLFMPATYCDNDFKDENGNTDVVASLEQELYVRAQKRKASSSSALDEYMMSRPLKPSEMFMSPGGNVFPVYKIRERIAEIESKSLFDLRASVGILEYVDKKTKTGVRWVEDKNRIRKPIKELNLDHYKGDLSSSIVVYEHPPERLPSSSYNKSLYKVVYDPVKDDNGGTSLASILVHKGFAADSWEEGMQDTIVAEFIGRLDQVEELHEIAIKLALYYNCKILPETNIPDFVRYARMENRYTILQLSPFIAISKAIANPGRKYDVGVTMSTNLGIHCEQLIRQRLLEKWKTTEDGRELTNIDKLLSLRLLYELANYDRKANCDHVSAYKLLCLWLSQEVLAPIELNQNADRNRELDDFIASKKREHKPLKNPFYGY